MDKFGIFKILSSLLQAASNSNSETNTANEKSPDNLSEIFNLLKGKTEANKDTKSEVDAEEKTKKEEIASPLKTRLLSTASSHDEFVKRVKKNNKL